MSHLLNKLMVINERTCWNVWTFSKSYYASLDFYRVLPPTTNFSPPTVFSLTLHHFACVHFVDKTLSSLLRCLDMKQPESRRTELTRSLTCVSFLHFYVGCCVVFSCVIPEELFCFLCVTHFSCLRSLSSEERGRKSVIDVGGSIQNKPTVHCKLNFKFITSSPWMHPVQTPDMLMRLWGRLKWKFDCS